MNLFLDSNVLIFANIKDVPEYPIAQSCIHQYINEGVQFHINSIIVSEVHYKLMKFLGMDESQRRVEKILKSSYVTYLPIEYGTIINAIDLSTRHKVMTNDAIIGQHALDIKSDGILTDNYRDFKKIPELSVIPIR